MAMRLRRIAGGYPEPKYDSLVTERTLFALHGDIFKSSSLLRKRLRSIDVPVDFYEMSRAYRAFPNPSRFPVSCIFQERMPFEAVDILRSGLDHFSDFHERIIRRGKPLFIPSQCSKCLKLDKLTT